MYLGRPPWDSGVTPPEVVRVVEEERFPPGRALDLGCGTGTNVLYFARHGFETSGVDIARLAILRAKWRLWHARRGERGLAPAHLMTGDVSRLPPGVHARAPYDLVLDLGCFHALPPDRRAEYAAGLRAVARPGTAYLLYIFRPPANPVTTRTRRGLTHEEVAATFSEAFRQVWVVEGTDGPRASAWYRFEV
jgi:SAM-dependent methyltransferase